MAITTTRRVKGRNMLPDKGMLRELTIKDAVVKGLTIEVSAKKEVPRLKMDRLEEVANRVLDKYQKIIQQEAKKLNDEIIGLKGRARYDTKNADKLLRDAEKMADSTEKSINNALKSVQSAINQDVQAELKKLGRDDRNLLEARVKVAMDVTFGVIGIAGKITKLAVSGGADVTAWIGLAKGLYDMAVLIKSACSDLDTRRKELRKALEKYVKEQAQIQKEKEKAQHSKFGKVQRGAKMAYRFASGSADKEAVACLKKYNNSVTKARNKVYNDWSPKLDQAEREFKSSQTVPEAKKLFTAFNDLKRASKDLTDQIDQNEAFSQMVEDALRKMGAKFDLRPFTEKIFTKEGLIETLKFANNVRSAASTVKDIVGEIAKAV